MQTYNFPVWTTQNGGLVRKARVGNGEKFIFVEKPDCWGLKVGDFMPPSWGVTPANDLARAESAPRNDDEFLFNRDSRQYASYGAEIL